MLSDNAFKRLSANTAMFSNTLALRLKTQNAMVLP